MNYIGSEDPAKIKAKRTKTGGRNPRLVTAMNEQALQASFMEDMEGHYRRLTPEEIAAQYPPEKVDQLLAAASENLKHMMGVKYDAAYLDS